VTGVVVTVHVLPTENLSVEGDVRKMVLDAVVIVSEKDLNVLDSVLQMLATVMALATKPDFHVADDVLQMLATVMALATKPAFHVADDVRKMALIATDGAITPASSAVGICVYLFRVYIKEDNIVAWVFVVLIDAVELVAEAEVDSCVEGTVL